MPGRQGGGRVDVPGRTVLYLSSTPAGAVAEVFAPLASWLPQMLGNIPFMPGEAFVFESTGGGGWGDPTRRSAQKVAEDVVNGFVSRERAEAQARARHSADAFAGQGI